MSSARCRLPTTALAEPSASPALPPPLLCPSPSSFGRVPVPLLLVVGYLLIVAPVWAGAGPIPAGGGGGSGSSSSSSSSTGAAGVGGFSAASESTPAVGSGDAWRIRINGTGFTESSPIRTAWTLYSNASSPTVLVVAPGPHAGAGAAAEDLTTWTNGLACDSPTMQSHWGSYPTDLGVYRVGNLPAARAHAASWTGIDGHFYLFGGERSGVDGGTLGDLWRFNRFSRSWALLSGNNHTDVAPSYGQWKMSHPSNTPGGRTRACATVDPAAGDVWLYGGSSDRAGNQVRADLWRWRHVERVWLWEAGSNQLSVTPVWGSKGTSYAADSTNGPGARRDAGCFVTSDGTLPSSTFWLFAGRDHQGSLLNALFSFNGWSNIWTWKHGSSLPGSANGVLVPSASTGADGLGLSDPSNLPPARYAFAYAYDPSAGIQGSLWVHGGLTGLSVGGPPTNLVISSALWRFDVNALAWALIDGDESQTRTLTTAQYGTKRTGSMTASQSRTGHFAAFDPSVHRLYLFGGQSESTPGAMDLSFASTLAYDVGAKKILWLSGNNAHNFALASYDFIPFNASGNALTGGNLWLDPSGGLWSGFGARLASEDVQCNDLLCLESRSRSLQIDVTLPAGRQLVLPAIVSDASNGQPIGPGTFTLGVDSTFATDEQLTSSIVFQARDFPSGANVSDPFTLTIVQMQPVADYSWTVVFILPLGGGSVSVSSSMPAGSAGRNLTFPAAMGQLSLKGEFVSLAQGAQIANYDHMLANDNIPLPAAGQTAVAAWRIEAADGSLGPWEKIYFIVEPFTLDSLSVVSRPGPAFGATLLSLSPPFTSSLSSLHYNATLPLGSLDCNVTLVFPLQVRQTAGLSFLVRWVDDGSVLYMDSTSSQNSHTVQISIQADATGVQAIEILPVAGSASSAMLASTVLTLIPTPLSVTSLMLQGTSAGVLFALPFSFSTVSLRYNVTVPLAKPLESLTLNWAASGGGALVAFLNDSTPFFSTAGDAASASATWSIPSNSQGDTTSVVRLYSELQQCNYTITVSNPPTFITSVSITGVDPPSAAARSPLPLVLTPATLALNQTNYTSSFHSSWSQLSLRFLVGDVSQLMSKLFVNGVDSSFPVAPSSLPYFLSIEEGNTTLTFVTLQGEYTFTVFNPAPSVRSVQLSVGGGMLQWPLVLVDFSPPFSPYVFASNMSASFLPPRGSTILLLRIVLTTAVQVSMLGGSDAPVTLQPNHTTPLELELVLVPGVWSTLVVAGGNEGSYLLSIATPVLSLASLTSMQLILSGLHDSSYPMLGVEDLDPWMSGFNVLDHSPSGPLTSILSPYTQLKFRFVLSTDDNLTFAADDDWRVGATVSTDRSHDIAGDEVVWPALLRTGQTNNITIRSFLFGDYTVSFDLPPVRVTGVALSATVGSRAGLLAIVNFSGTSRNSTVLPPCAAMPASADGLSLNFTFTTPTVGFEPPCTLFLERNLSVSFNVNASQPNVFVPRSVLPPSGTTASFVFHCPSEGSFVIPVRMGALPFVTLDSLRFVGAGLTAFTGDTSLAMDPPWATLDCTSYTVTASRAYPSLNVTFVVDAGDTISFAMNGGNPVPLSSAPGPFTLPVPTLPGTSMLVTLSSAQHGDFDFLITVPPWTVTSVVSRVRFAEGPSTSFSCRPQAWDPAVFSYICVAPRTIVWHAFRALSVWQSEDPPVRANGVIVPPLEIPLRIELGAMQRWNVTVDTREGMYVWQFYRAQPYVQQVSFRVRRVASSTSSTLAVAPGGWDGQQEQGKTLYVPSDAAQLEVRLAFWELASVHAQVTVRYGAISVPFGFSTTEQSTSFAFDPAVSQLVLSSPSENRTYTVSIQLAAPPVASFTASHSVLTECDTLLLDGRASNWPATDVPPMEFEWRITSISTTVGGAELLDATSAAFNATLAGLLFSRVDSAVLRGTETLPSSSFVSLSSMRLLAGCTYTFRLRVGAAAVLMSAPQMRTVSRVSSGAGPLDAHITGAPDSGSITVNDALNMTVAARDPACPNSALVYAWSCPDCALPSSVALNTPTLRLLAGWLPADKTYRFTVLTSLQFNAGRRVTTQIAVLVTRAPSVSASAGIDPCAGRTLCDNRGKCVATADSGAAAAASPPSYTLSCACPVAPFAFYGAHCSLAVLACPGCVSRYVGGQFVSLYGVGLDSLQTIAVAGRLTSFELSGGLDVNDAEVTSVLASIGQQYATRLQSVRFLSPALVTVNSSANGTAPLSLTSRRLLENPRSAYQTLTLRSSYARGDGSDQPLELNYTRLLYYSSSTCLSAGEWKEDGLGGCLLCPTGGFCPGGGRVWPQAGYWSWSEFQAPMACAIPEACPGVDAAGGGSHSAANGGAGFTQQCSADYSGPTCAQCSTGAYRLNGRCYQCTESTTDQDAILSLTIIVGLSLMGGLSLAVAFLPAMRLAEVIQLLLIVQGLAMVGVEAAKDLPLFKQEVSAVFSYLNFVNADVEVLRPGCGGVPDFTYVDKLRLSLLFMLITACMFLAGCVLRFLFHRRRGGTVTVQQAGDRTVAVDGEEEEEEEEQSQSAGSRNARQSSKLRATDGDLPTLDQPAVTSASVAPTITLRPLSAALDFKYRAIHAFLILLALFYLRLSILFFKAFRCVEAADPLADPDAAADDATVQTTTSYVLEEDMQTLCYTGEHLAVAVGVSILLLCYSFGFPLLTFGLLVRAFGDQYHTEGLLGWMRGNCAWLRPRTKRPLRALVVERPGGDAEGEAAVDRPIVVANNGWVAESGNKYAAPPSSMRVQVEAARKQRMREAAFGFLFLEFRHAAFFSIALIFLSSLTFAAINVYLLSTLPKLFCFGLIWTAQLLCTLLWLPYADWRMNLKNVAVGFGSLAHSVVLLGLQTDGSTSALFFVLLIFFLLLLALLCVRGRVAKALPCLGMADTTLLFRIGVGANKVQPEVSAKKQPPLSDPSPSSSRSSGSPQRSGPDTGTNGSSSSGSGRGEGKGGGGAAGGSGGSQVHPLPLALASPSQQGERSSHSATATSTQLNSPAAAAVVSPTSLREVNVAAAAPSPPSQTLRGQSLPPLVDPTAPAPFSSSAPVVPPPAASSDDASVELQRIASSSLPSSLSSATNRSRPSSAVKTAAAAIGSAAAAAEAPSRPSLLAPGSIGTVGGGGAGGAAGGKAPLQLAPLRVNKTKPMNDGAV